MKRFPIDILIIITLFALPLAANTPLVRVTIGRVEARSRGAWTSLTKGEALASNVRIRTAANAGAIFALTNADALTLAGGSVFDYRSNAILLRSGALRVTTGVLREITTQFLAIEVEDASVAIRYDAKTSTTSVAVFEGAATIRSREQRTNATTIQAGYTFTIIGDRISEGVAGIYTPGAREWRFVTDRLSREIESLNGDREW